MDLRPYLTVAIDRGQLARDTDDVLGAIEQATYRALDGAAERVAERARAQHWYRNRTGDLEGSTQAQDAEGPVWTDSASASVAATMPYAVYVNAHSPILEPAYAAVSAAVENDVLNIFREALAR